MMNCPIGRNALIWSLVVINVSNQLYIKIFSNVLFYWIILWLSDVIFSELEDDVPQQIDLEELKPLKMYDVYKG